jgi:hypothetical protein
VLQRTPSAPVVAIIASVKRPIAIWVCGVALIGVGEARVRDVAHALREQTDVEADARSIGGTILHSEARAGYVTLDARSRVEPGPSPHRYRGSATI